MTTPVIAKKEIPTIQVKIGFSEGLNFGCGFFVAGFLFFIVAVPLAIFIAGLMSLGIY